MLKTLRQIFVRENEAPPGAAVPPGERGNRIGIDTGAYSSGRLTALVLEGQTRRYIEAIDDGVTITAAPRRDHRVGTAEKVPGGL